MADTQTIKDRIDIVQLIGEYIKLKKAGANWKANCPFHHEKSPSFMVHPEKQIWHCFGCGKGGDIFTFIQEIEGLEFTEALKLLANRAGVKLENRQSEMNQSQRNRLAEVTKLAAYFFHHILLELPAAALARAYLEKRGLTSNTITEWEIGYAPDQWDLLTKYATRKGFGIEDCVAAGLTIKRDSADALSGRGYYDRFRGRIMFPIRDPHGTVVGFTGRVLVETPTSGGKYVNTPQTVLYDKSRVLYGIDKAKQAIKSVDMAVLVEGQMDVLACHQAGMKNVVAASGTALTYEQIRLIKRYTNNISLAFDADSAGQKAGERGIAVALREGVNVRVIQIPPGGGKDADECLRQNKAIWFESVTNACDIMDWFFDRAFANYNPNDSKAKRRIAEYLLGHIIQIASPVERDDWLKKLSDRLGIEVSILREEAQKIPRERDTISPGTTSMPTTKAPSKIPHADEMLQHQLWVRLVKSPDLFSAYYPSLQPEFFKGTAYERLYEIAEKLYTTRRELDVDTLRTLANVEGQENIIDILLLNPADESTTDERIEPRQELAAIIHRIRTEWSRRRAAFLAQQISNAEQHGNQAEIIQLIKELQDLQEKASQ